MSNVTDTHLRHPWFYDILFILVFVLAGYLRLTGVNWGEGEHQHPDENFLTGVLGSLRAHACTDETVPIDACPTEQRRWLTVSEYFNSQESTLNPYNRGYTFFVYGNLPMTLVRVFSEAMDKVDVKTLGRQFSALADLAAIFFLYLLVSTLYGRKVGLLASLFSALTVMQIQQSHFFTTDLFVNTFAFLAVYFAVLILVDGEQRMEDDTLQRTPVPILKFLFTNRLFLYCLGFGLAFGMALASKVNIYPLAVMLPAAFALRYFITDHHTLTADDRPQTVSTLTQRAWAEGEGESPVIKEEEQGQGGMVHHPRSLNTNYYLLILACLIVGGLAAFITFRIFQPYAFDGLLPSQQWIANIREQRLQATGEGDVPWSLQWARRTHLYSFTNLTVWGLGLPLGLLAWAGFLYMGWRIIKGEWRHALLWGWTAAYFLWQSFQFNPTMRYQLPIYPLLAMMAAWFIFELANTKIESFKRFNLSGVYAGFVAFVVIALTAAWAFAFQSIYTRDEPRIAASRWILQNVPGPINVEYQTNDGTYKQPLPFPTDGFIQAGAPYQTAFTAQESGLIESITLGHALNNVASPSTLSLTLSDTFDATSEQALAAASLTSDFSADKDPRGDSYVLVLDKPLPVEKGQQYFLNFNLDNGSLLINGASVANETDYDYGLPFRIDNYDPFGGIYRGDQNLQVYWDDNAEKLERFVSTLDQSDYIFIPTNHQYAQITRLPERYPLTTFYYRELMGCPPEADIITCYHEAQPGDYEGRLGYDLVQVFETFPKLGSIEINDQYAEEAFTFYDHPKVFVFKKNSDFSANQVRSVLSTVDLSKAVHLTPRQFDDYRDLLLTKEQLATQRAGGTWSELFNYESIQNKYPVIGLILWYLFIFILGLVVYPITRLAMPGLGDKGYPLSRALGIVLLGYFSWLGGSLGIPYTRSSIEVVFVLIFLAGAALAWYQREELREEWKAKRKYFLIIEGLFIAFFVIDFLIRVGNPDLWHVAKGGERPMDFSYFNAVIKSTSFPPYDPWYAGGYINYYYYGFVLMGTLVKLLGIVPSIAYNFILPTLFALVGICAFSIGWNLLSRDEGGRMKEEESTDQVPSFIISTSALTAGLAAAALAILLGNLGTIQLVYLKLQQIGAEGLFSWDAGFLERTVWAFRGLSMNLKGQPLAIGPGDWYWNPSRVIQPGPDNSITEFPLFTFLYSDLHAHMIVMPLALLAISWALSVVMARAKWKNRASVVLGFVIGGLIVGAIYPTNLSDSYTYLLICIIALAYSVWRYVETKSLTRRILLTLGAVAALYLLSNLLYEPYRTWYGQAYSALDPWKGPFTPITPYLIMWLVFLFILVSWMAWETHEWMAFTPLSALKRLKPYQLLIEGALVTFVFVLVYFQYNQSSTAYDGMTIAWIAFPLAAWAGVLLLNPRLDDAKRFVLFLIGTALLITIVVEVAVVRGDIGRQNTIFKFYMQVWLMFAVSSGAAIAWTLSALHKWSPGWRVFWQTAMIILVAGAALFTLTGTFGKIKDRWFPEAPRTLDSMTYMNYAQYDTNGQRLDLSEDYRAIRWMQDNVQGSPVIVEANCVEYGWCTRYTIYTGLPGVVGWNWHQRQQRVYDAIKVQSRVDQVNNFYNTTDIQSARDFLKAYAVKYIIVGGMERATYAPEGIAKFEQYNGEYWQEVYRDGSTVIYEVTP